MFFLLYLKDVNFDVKVFLEIIVKYDIYEVSGIFCVIKELELFLLEFVEKR